MVTVRELTPSELAYVDSTSQSATRVAWEGTHVGVLEIQDVYVFPERRSREIATLPDEAAELEARARPFEVEDTLVYLRKDL